MYAGVRARSTFPTKHPSHRVSTLNRHEEKTRLFAPYSRVARRESGTAKDVTFSVCACVLPRGRTLRGRTVLQEKERKKEKRKRKKKVIINHIYDALQEPTWERMNDR